VKRVARLVIAAIAAALLTGCSSHVDFSGTYVGEATIAFTPKEGSRVEHRVANEAVVVKMRMRSYQYSDYTLQVRGCEVNSKGGGTTRWYLGSGPCAFDVPNVGNVNVTFEAGGLERIPDTQSSKPRELHISFYGKTDKGDSVSYTIDAKPK